MKLFAHILTHMRINDIKIMYRHGMMIVIPMGGILLCAPKNNFFFFKMHYYYICTPISYNLYIGILTKDILYTFSLLINIHGDCVYAL